MRKNKKLLDEIRWFAEMRRIEALHAVRVLADKARDLQAGVNVDYWAMTNTDWCERRITDEITAPLEYRRAN
jgi:hypothetical protein